MSDQPRPEWMFRVAARAVIVFVRTLRWRLDIRGTDHIPATGGAVVTFNHHSYADFFLCAWGVYRTYGRPVRFLTKQEVFDHPVAGPVLRGAGQIPVARGSRTGRKNAYMEAVRRLRAGEVIAVAPEQTISRSFELLPFSTGAVRMARDAGVPLVPSVSWGTQRWATKGRPINWRAVGIPVLVRYGPPIHFTPDEDPHAATDRLRKVTEEMLAEIQNSYPDRPAPGQDWWLPRRLGGSAPAHQDVLGSYRRQQARWRDRG